MYVCQAVQLLLTPPRFLFFLTLHSLTQFFFEREKKWFIPRYFRAMSSKPLYSLVTKVGCSVPEMGPYSLPHSLIYTEKKEIENKFG